MCGDHAVDERGWLGLGRVGFLRIHREQPVHSRSFGVADAPTPVLRPLRRPAQLRQRHQAGPSAAPSAARSGRGSCESHDEGLKHLATENGLGTRRTAHTFAAYRWLSVWATVVYAVLGGPPREPTRIPIRPIQKLSRRCTSVHQYRSISHANRFLLTVSNPSLTLGSGVQVHRGYQHRGGVFDDRRNLLRGGSGLC